MSSVKKEEGHDEEADEIQELAAYKAEKLKKPWLFLKLDCCKNENCISSYYYKNKNTRNESVVPSLSTTGDETIKQEPITEDKFGWATLGKIFIPYLIRSEDKYCAVRMLEVNVLKDLFDHLHQDIIYHCTSIRSYYITKAESKLLNYINVLHCDSQFGDELFTTKDLIVRLSDADEFFNFLNACYNTIFSGSQTVTDRCGFIAINNQDSVPYTMHNSQIYLPLFYFEGDIDHLKRKSEKLEGWDLSYLKFCFKVHGIRNELFAHDSCTVISLNDIKDTFPPGTLFQTYWPVRTDASDLMHGTAQTQKIQWTITPEVASSMSSNPSTSSKPATETKTSTEIRNVHQAMSASNTNSPITVTPANHMAQPSGASSGAQPPLNPVRQLEPGPRFHGPQHDQRMEAVAPEVAASHTNAQTAATAQRVATPANYMMPPLVRPSGASYGAQQVTPQPAHCQPPLNPVQELQQYLRFHERQHGQRREAVAPDLAASHTNAQRTATPANFMMPPPLVQSSGASCRAQQMTPQPPKHQPPLNPARQLKQFLHFHEPKQGQRMEAVSSDGVAASHTNAQRTATPANFMMPPPLLQSSGAPYGPQPMIPQQRKYQPPLNPERPLEQGLIRLPGPHHQQGQGMGAVGPGVAPAHRNAETTATVQRTATPANYMMPPPLVQSPYGAQQVTPEQLKYPPPRIPVGQLKPDLIRFYEPYHQQGQGMGAVDLGVAASHTNAQRSATPANYMMPALVQSRAHRPRQRKPQEPKYQPPLNNPARHLKRRHRFNAPHHQQGQGIEVIYPGGNRSQQPPAMINLQPAHQQSSSNQPSTSADNHNNIPYGGILMNRPLKPLPDPPTSGSHIPYQLQVALLQGKPISCINMKPYVFTELLVTLRDLVSIFFNNVPVQICEHVMSTLGIELYKANNSQMRVLLQYSKCQNLNEVVPLVLLQSIIDYMPQLMYIIGGILKAAETDQMVKRQRTR